MRVGDEVQSRPESALREMSSSSANAFPAKSSAAFVLPCSSSSRSFHDFSFLFSACSGASSSDFGCFARFPDVAGSVSFCCWPRQCLKCEWYSRSRRSSSPRSGLPSGRASNAASGHLTIMSAHRSLVSECHRRGLRGPISPCLTSKGLIDPMSHKFDRDGAIRALKIHAA
jgi:hypothetical protein